MVKNKSSKRFPAADTQDKQTGLLKGAVGLMAILLVTTVIVLAFFGVVAYYLFKGLALDTWSHDEQNVWMGYNPTTFEK